jgi:hypothetical protein
MSYIRFPPHTCIRITTDHLVHPHPHHQVDEVRSAGFPARIRVDPGRKPFLSFSPVCPGWVECELIIDVTSGSLVFILSSWMSRVGTGSGNGRYRPSISSGLGSKRPERHATLRQSSYISLRWYGILPDVSFPFVSLVAPSILLDTPSIVLYTDTRQTSFFVRRTVSDIGHSAFIITPHDPSFSSSNTNHPLSRYITSPHTLYDIHHLDHPLGARQAVVPAWPVYRRHPVKWLEVRKSKVT